MLRTASATLIAAALLASPATAQTEAWSAMAEADLAAARKFLVDTHPGAVPETGDRDFIAALERGGAEAARLARQARSYGGYRAALMRFAAEFDDAHISSAPNFPVPQRWPGFAVAHNGQAWEVIARADEQAPAVGSRLVSCDGKSPDRLATERLAPFTSDWSVKTQRMRASTTLLRNFDNPAHPPLTECVFAGPGGQPAPHRLDWRKLDSAEWYKHIDPALPSASEESYFRPFDQGYWVRLATLSAGTAFPIVKQAEEQKDRLRAAPFVVVDLRANAGGASVFTDKLAEAIYGARAVARAQRKSAIAPDVMIWRATPSTRDEAEAYVKRGERFGAPDDPFLLSLYAQRDAIVAALETGSPLAKRLAEVPVSAARARDEVRNPPRVILVTDRECFSSCLLGVKLFRELGALHVGEETNANTHYSSLKTIDLPSGLSNFSTMQSYMQAIPRKLGPFTPSINLDRTWDDASVQQSIRKLLSSENKR